MALSSEAALLEAEGFRPHSKQVGLWTLAFQRLCKNRLALAGGIVAIHHGRVA